MAGFGLKVGFRFFKAKKSSFFLSVISAISVTSVAVGVLAMVVTLSVMSGFEGELKKRLFQAETHIRVENENGATFKDNPQMAEKIMALDPRMRTVDPVYQTEMILKSGKRVGGAILKGVGEPQWKRTRSFVKDWAASQFLSTGEPRALVGQEMAFELGLAPGDVITVISPTESSGPLEMAPRMMKFVVEGVYKSGVPEQELQVVYTEIKNVESFLRREGLVSQYEITVNDLQEAAEVAPLIQQHLGTGYLVRSWQDLNAHLFSSLKLERLVMFCILVFIMIVASFNILSVLTMTVMEKRRSISILRAMGATGKQISKIFLSMGSAIALVGIGFGGGLGLLVCWVLKKYPIIELPDIYYDRTLPVMISPMTLGLVFATAFFIVLAGSFFPSSRASKINPLDGIKS